MQGPIASFHDTSFHTMPACHASMPSWNLPAVSRQKLMGKDLHHTLQPKHCHSRTLCYTTRSHHAPAARSLYEYRTPREAWIKLAPPFYIPSTTLHRIASMNRFDVHTTGEDVVKALGSHAASKTSSIPPISNDLTPSDCPL